MMHLDDFLVVILAQRLRSDLRQVKKKVHAHGEIRGENHGEYSCAAASMAFRSSASCPVVPTTSALPFSSGQLSASTPGKANDAGELDQRIASINHLENVVALVDPGDQFQLWILVFAKRMSGFAHPAFRPDNDNLSCYLSIP